MILEQSSQSAMIEDLTSLLPIVILICVLVICYCFRSLTLGACILVPGGDCSMHRRNGQLSSFSFNNISIIAPLGNHHRCRQQRPHHFDLQTGTHFRHGQAVAMSTACPTIFSQSLAALTTAIGFSSLNMTSSPAIQDFGQIVAVGIVFAYGLTFTMLPANMVWFTPSANRICRTKPFSCSARLTASSLLPTIAIGHFSALHGASIGHCDTTSAKRN